MDSNKNDNNSGAAEQDDEQDELIRAAAAQATVQETERNLSGLLDAAMRGGSVAGASVASTAAAGEAADARSTLAAHRRQLEAMLAAQAVASPPPPPPAAAAAAAVSDEEINTFCEFTGLADKEMARAYLSETETLEEAVNLCLSGVGIDALRSSRAPPPAAASRVPPHLQAHLEALLGEGRSSSIAETFAQIHALTGGGGEHSQFLAQMEARMHAAGVDFNLPHGAGRGLTRQSSSNEANMLGLASLGGKNAIVDEEMRIDANVEALRAGLWDKAAAEIGGACVAWAKVTQKYIDAGLLHALSEALPESVAAGEDVMAVRVLQLTEMIVRIFGDGHGKAALTACGWFITSRRSVSRKFVRSSNSFEVYMKQIVPSSDLKALKKMWKSDTFDPSWRHRESGFDMLTFAVYNACAPDMLAYLVNPISGCRGVVNINKNAVSPHGSPLMIAAKAQCVTEEHMKRDVARHKKLVQRRLKNRHKKQRHRNNKKKEREDSSLRMMSDSSVTSNSDTWSTESGSTVSSMSSYGNNSTDDDNDDNDDEDDDDDEQQERERTDSSSSTNSFMSDSNVDVTGDLEAFRNEWSKHMVRILLAAGASVKNITPSDLASFTPAARLQIQMAMRQQSDNSTVSSPLMRSRKGPPKGTYGNHSSAMSPISGALGLSMDEQSHNLMRGELFARKTGKMRASDVCAWWKYGAPNIFAALLQSIACARLESTAHRALEVLCIFVSRFRKAPHWDALFVLKSGNGAVLAATMQLFQSLFTGDHDDTTALLLAVRTVEALLDATQLSDANGKVDNKNNNKKKKEEEDNNHDQDVRAFHAQLCLGLCRFGVTHRLMLLAQPTSSFSSSSSGLTSSSRLGSPTRGGATSTAGGASSTTRPATPRTPSSKRAAVAARTEAMRKMRVETVLQACASDAVNVIRRTIVTDLELDPETLNGRSPVLVQVCKGLEEGRLSSLHHLVRLLGKPTPGSGASRRNSSASGTSSGTKEEEELDDPRTWVWNDSATAHLFDPSPDEDGITPFEFERSGVASALLTFLQVDMVPGREGQGQVVNMARLSQLLAAMPPPVSVSDTRALGALDAIGAGYDDELEDHGDEDEDENVDVDVADAALADTPSTGAGVVGDIGGADYDDDDDEEEGMLQEETRRQRQRRRSRQEEEVGRVLVDRRASELVRQDSMRRGHSLSEGVPTIESGTVEALRGLSFRFGSRWGGGGSAVADSRDKKSGRRTRGNSNLNRNGGNNLAMDSILSLDGGASRKQQKDNKDSGSSFSALHRLIGKLQSVISIHAPHSFPVLSHRGQSDGGVRALVNPIKLILRRDALDHSTRCHRLVKELVVQVLPLTPLRELELQVLRATRITDPKYVKFCGMLVGMKIRHRPSQCRMLEKDGGPRQTDPHTALTRGHDWERKDPVENALAQTGSDFTVSIVKEYDSETGAHRLMHVGRGTRQAQPESSSFLSSSSSSSEWVVLAVREYFVMERVFESPHTVDTCEAATLSLVDDGGVVDEEVRSTASTGASSHLNVEEIISPGDRVAVWWPGSAATHIQPGWREAVIEAIREPLSWNRMRRASSTSSSLVGEDGGHFYEDDDLFDDEENEECFDVVYQGSGLMQDGIIRVGDKVKMIEDLDQLKALSVGHGGWANDMPEFIGDVARVLTIRGTRVSTSGLGGYVYNIRSLTKVSDSPSLPGAIESTAEMGGAERRPTQGDTVVLAPSCMDLGGLQRGERGVIVEDDGSARPYRVRLRSSRTHWYMQEEVKLVDIPADELAAAAAYVATALGVDQTESKVARHRISLLSKTQECDHEHCFAVEIRAPLSEQEQAKEAALAVKEKLLSAAAATENAGNVGRKEPVKPEMFQLNDRIEGRYGGRSRWYPGVIARVNADGTFDIAYDDGDSERGVSQSMIAHVGETHKKGTKTSYDFRKVFSNSVGRMLFDALRREDNVLSQEYNFVTRGFEHQPSFYQGFAETLEADGYGTFAQFQTRSQAEELYTRIAKLRGASVSSTSSPPSSPRAGAAEGVAVAGAEPRLVDVRVVVMRRPVVMPLAVQRDIQIAFEQLNRKNGNWKSPPPPPGHRAQVDVIGFALYQHELNNALINKEVNAGNGGHEEATYLEFVSDARTTAVKALALQTAAVGESWLSATVVAAETQITQVDNQGAMDETTKLSPNEPPTPNTSTFRCVLDDGTVLIDVPENLVRVTQRTSRSFPFKRPGETANQAPPSSPRSPAHRMPPEPLELSRQFTAFGEGTAYKHIQVAGVGDDAEAAARRSDLRRDSASTVGGGGEYNESTMTSADASRASASRVPCAPADELLIPPVFEVDFVVVSNGEEDGDEFFADGDDSDNEFGQNGMRGLAITAGDGGGMSMFQCLYQLFHSERPALDGNNNSNNNNGRSLADWASEYRLNWRVRVVFEGDEKDEDKHEHEHEGFNAGDNVVDKVAAVALSSADTDTSSAPRTPSPPRRMSRSAGKALPSLVVSVPSSNSNNKSASNRVSDNVVNRLPYKSTQELINATKASPPLEKLALYAKIKQVVPNAADWARRNGLAILVDPSVKESSREVKRLSWAKIAVAYAQLCRMPLAVSTPRKGAGRGLTGRPRPPGLILSGFNDTESRAPPELMSPRGSMRSPLRSPRRLKPVNFIDDGRNVNVDSVLDGCNVPMEQRTVRDSLCLLKVLYDELVERSTHHTYQPDALTQPGANKRRLAVDGDSDTDDEGPQDDGEKKNKNKKNIGKGEKEEEEVVDPFADLLAPNFAHSLPWRNTVMSSQLREQLSNPLSIATRCFPRWVELLPRVFSFLFRIKDREVHLRCTSLGISRAVAWLQDEVTGYKAKKKQLAQVTLEMSAMFQGIPDMVRFEKLQIASDRLEDELRAIEQEHCIGHLQQDLVKVSRATLLRDSELLMDQHKSERSELVIQFLNETASGDGVTADYYSSVAAKLQELSVNDHIPMWADGREGKLMVHTSGDTKSNERENEVDKNMSTGDVGLFKNNDSIPVGRSSSDPHGEDNEEEEEELDAHIIHRQGLYPQPLSPIESLSYPTNVQESGDEKEKSNSRVQALVVKEARRLATRRNRRVVERFRFLGRLMGKAFLDGMHVPIPLSLEFLVLVKYRQKLGLGSVALVEGGAEGDGADTVATTTAVVADVVTTLEQTGLMDVAKMEEDMVTAAMVGGGGLVSLLFGLWRRGTSQDLLALRERLDMLDVRFVDPSQGVLISSNGKRRVISSALLSSAASEETDGAVASFEGAGGVRLGVVRHESNSSGLGSAGSGVSSSEHKDNDEDEDEVVGHKTSSEETGQKDTAKAAAAAASRQVPGKGEELSVLSEYVLWASEQGLSQKEIDNRLAQAGHGKLQRWKALKSTQSIRTRIAIDKADASENKRVNQDLSLRAAELVPGGVRKRVTMENLGEYLQLIAERWLYRGVMPQAESFRRGMCEVLGDQGCSAMFNNCSPTELRTMLCGKDQVKWEDNDPLLGCLLPMGKYTPESPSIVMLVQALKEMNMKERSQFLSFTTSQPRVPLSGLPQIKVYPPSFNNVAGVVLNVGPMPAASTSEAETGGDPSAVGVMDCAGRQIKVGDHVMLEESMWDAVSEGPLMPGEASTVEEVEAEDRRVKVVGWWYEARCMRHIDSAGSELVAAACGAADAKLRCVETDVVVSIASYSTDTNALLFAIGTKQRDRRRGFKPGQVVRVLDGKGQLVSGLPSLSVSMLVEQPDAIQMAPYLRPMATTCAKTLYLPEEYDSHKHMLEILRGAFEDAKLGGIQDR